MICDVMIQYVCEMERWEMRDERWENKFLWHEICDKNDVWIAISNYWFHEEESDPMILHSSNCTKVSTQYHIYPNVIKNNMGGRYKCMDWWFMGLDLWIIVIIVIVTVIIVHQQRQIKIKCDSYHDADYVMR
jgi:hypothetical protein